MTTDKTKHIDVALADYNEAAATIPQLALLMTMAEAAGISIDDANGRIRASFAAGDRFVSCDVALAEGRVVGTVTWR